MILFICHVVSRCVVSTYRGLALGAVENKSDVVFSGMGFMVRVCRGDFHGKSSESLPPSDRLPSNSLSKMELCSCPTCEFLFHRCREEAILC